MSGFLNGGPRLYGLPRRPYAYPRCWGGAQIESPVKRRRPVGAIAACIERSVPPALRVGPSHPVCLYLHARTPDSLRHASAPPLRRARRVGGVTRRGCVMTEASDLGTIRTLVCSLAFCAQVHAVLQMRPRRPKLRSPARDDRCFVSCCSPSPHAARPHSRSLNAPARTVMSRVKLARASSSSGRLRLAGLLGRSPCSRQLLCVLVCVALRDGAVRAPVSLEAEL